MPSDIPLAMNALPDAGKPGVAPFGAKLKVKTPAEAGDAKVMVVIRLTTTRAESRSGCIVDIAFSFGGVGCLKGVRCFYDNALAETINGLYKAEVIHRRGPWRPFEAVECATSEWVDWFNRRRLREPIGNIPPAEAEDRYDAMLDEPAMAA